MCRQVVQRKSAGSNPPDQVRVHRDSGENDAKAQPEANTEGTVEGIGPELSPGTPGCPSLDGKLDRVEQSVDIDKPCQPKRRSDDEDDVEDHAL